MAEPALQREQRTIRAAPVSAAADRSHAPLHRPGASSRAGVVADAQAGQRARAREQSSWLAGLRVSELDQTAAARAALAFDHANAVGHRRRSLAGGVPGALGLGGRRARRPGQRHDRAVRLRGHLRGRARLHARLVDGECGGRHDVLRRSARGRGPARLRARSAYAHLERHDQRRGHSLRPRGRRNLRLHPRGYGRHAAALLRHGKRAARPLRLRRHSVALRPAQQRRRYGGPGRRLRARLSRRRADLGELRALRVPDRRSPVFRAGRGHERGCGLAPLPDSVPHRHPAGRLAESEAGAGAAHHRRGACSRWFRPRARAAVRARPREAHRQHLGKAQRYAAPGNRW